MSLSAALILILVSALSTGIIVMALRAGAKARAAQEEMARQQGWTYSYSPASGGSGSRTVIADPSEGWTLTLYSQSSRSGSSNSGSTVRWSEFQNPGPKIDSGMALLGPDIPDKTAEMADKMLGIVGGNIGRMILDKMTGGLGDEAASLRSVPDHGAPGTLMASPGAEEALEAVRYAPELELARQGRNEMDQPIVMRGTFGLRIRVRRLLRKPDEIEDFVALGRALTDNLASAE